MRKEEMVLVMFVVMVVMLMEIHVVLAWVVVGG